MKIFEKSFIKRTQENCLAIILYLSKKYFKKKKIQTHRKTVKRDDFSLQMIYLVYVTICGTKNII